MMSVLLFLQAAATNANNAATKAAAQPPLERQPALMSLIYMGGLALMALWLVVALIRNRRQRSALAAIAPADLPAEVRERLGTTSTNRGLRALRWLFIVLALSVFGFHVYWAKFAAQTNERFQQLSYKDQRNRRLIDSTLRGWILDRTGKLENALALYRKDSNGEIVRDYPMDPQFAQLFGTDYGAPGLERALFGVQSTEVPEALQVVLGQNMQQKASRDVQLTIHHELQQAIVDQLHGRAGAVVILNPQTGEVLGLYSNPTYSIKGIQDETQYQQLETDKINNPLVSRALHQYYVPGSTFKTFMLIAAHRAGFEDRQFVCSGSGYFAMNGAKPIFDDGGPKEVHGPLGIDRAYEVSCNQYFAHMAVELGPDRLRETAKLLGVGAYDNPMDTLRGRTLPDFWNASSDAVKRALAPTEATIATGKIGKEMSPFDLALEGYGQGYAGQMTPFQMALFASAIGNMNGDLMRPRIEMDPCRTNTGQAVNAQDRGPCLPDQVYSHVMAPQIAQRLRDIMGLVTEGPEGTARGVFGPVKAAGISTGGKTGTAQKILPVIDPKTGQYVTRVVLEKDVKGNVIGRHTEVVQNTEHPRIDSWFLCIAPREHPQIAIAVIVEGGGYGSRTAAPIAAALVLKARDLGLLGTPPAQGQTPGPQNKQRQAGARQVQPAPRQRNTNQ